MNIHFKFIYSIVFKPSCKLLSCFAHTVKIPAEKIEIEKFQELNRYVVSDLKETIKI